ncbi:hypothetical protein [Pyrobaculum aerophilum]|nr:hypothetical protein [Pyrobaculum aerophilum]
MLIQHSTGLHPYPQTLLITAAAALALQSVAGLYFLFKLARWRQP